MKYEFFNSPVHGIGCISTQDIKQGDIVAKEPYFAIPRHIKNYAKPVFKDYYWNIESTSTLINGLGNYCNHSDNNNITPLLKFTNEPYITFIALRDIKKGEELFNNYGPDYWTLRKNNTNNNQAPKQNNGMFFFNY